MDSRQGNRPIAPRHSADGPYRPAHRTAEDTVDLLDQAPAQEPPSWLLSGTLIGLAVIVLLIGCVWLAYHIAQSGVR
jgi:hypothetical protein